MRAPRTSTLRRTVAAGACLALTGGLAACNNKDSASGSDYPSETVSIMVPAAAGGGWDSTGRAMQQVIQDQNVVDQSVEVFNVEGGGGATGLAQLQKDKGDPQKLMMTGLVMIGALQLAKSEVSLDDTTPIATLTAEAEAFVVPADSPYKSIKDVVDAAKADPSSVAFGGGSAGGSDQLVAAELLKEAGADAGQMKYVGYSGGGEATAGILSGDVEVGVSGISEFTSQIESGKMRLLAVSTADPVDVGGKPAPTLQDAGYDIDFANWRAIVAAPGLSDDQQQAVIKMVDKMHGTKAWQTQLEKNDWTDFYKTGDEAKKYIDDETQRVNELYQDLGL